jgi:hypothetical protein
MIPNKVNNKPIVPLMVKIINGENNLKF